MFFRLSHFLYAHKHIINFPLYNFSRGKIDTFNCNFFLNYQFLLTTITFRHQQK